MNIIFTVLVALPLGYLVHSRAAACAIYLGGSAFVFAFQSVNLLLEWVDGSMSAFGGPFPGHEASRIFGYGLLNLIITAIGIGIVLLGALVRTNRQSRVTTQSVHS